MFSCKACVYHECMTSEEILLLLKQGCSCLCVNRVLRCIGRHMYGVVCTQWIGMQSTGSAVIEGCCCVHICTDTER